MSVHERFLEKFPKAVRKKDLSNLTTIRVGGEADLFLAIKTEEELISAICLARSLDIPYFVLGGGSNVVISENGICGLVVKIENDSIDENDETIIVGAGALLSEVVEYTRTHSLSGLEWAAGIPGTIGGAVYGNAGAYGSSMADAVISIRLVSEKGDIIEYSNSDMGFDYRSSVLKKAPREHRPIISLVTLRLSFGDSDEIGKRIDSILATREKSLPKEYSAGCVLRNPLLTDDLRSRIPSDIIRGPRAPIGWMVEKLGLKDAEIGGAKISERHGNIVVNMGDASSGDIRQAIDLIKNSVKKEYDIDLEEEVEYVDN